MPQPIFGKNHALRGVLYGNHEPSILRRFINKIAGSGEEDFQLEPFSRSVEIFEEKRRRNSVANQQEGDGN